MAVRGYAVGIDVLRILRRLPTVRRVLKVGGILALISIVILSQVAARYLVTGTVSIETLLSLISFAPLVDYLALGSVGTPISATITPTAVVVLVTWIGLTPVGCSSPSARRLLSGVTRQSINAIERGRYDPSLELALKFAAEFDIPVEELLWLE